MLMSENAIGLINIVLIVLVFLIFFYRPKKAEDDGREVTEALAKLWTCLSVANERKMGVVSHPDFSGIELQLPRVTASIFWPMESALLEHPLEPNFTRTIEVTLPKDDGTRVTYKIDQGRSASRESPERNNEVTWLIEAIGEDGTTVPTPRVVKQHPEQKLLDLLEQIFDFAHAVVERRAEAIRGTSPYDCPTEHPR